MKSHPLIRLGRQKGVRVKVKDLVENPLWQGRELLARNGFFPYDTVFLFVSSEGVSYCSAWEYYYYHQVSLKFRPTSDPFLDEWEIDILAVDPPKDYRAFLPKGRDKWGWR